MDDEVTAEAYDRQAAAFLAQGRQAEATGALCAAMALRDGSALAFYNLGTAYLQANRLAEAEAWYRRALAADADLVAANQNLAVVLERLGRLDEAAPFRARALARHWLQVEEAGPEAPRVLILAASGLGNVPLDALLPRGRTTRLVWFLEYAPDAGESLPPYDLVFNAIGDADLAGPATTTLAAFLARNTRPLLNRPARVALTRRHAMPELLGDIPDLVVPPVLRWRAGPEGAAALAAVLAARQDMPPPWLLRPIGSHGGIGLVRCDDAAALAALALRSGEDYYLTAFHDYRGPDGFFRKYRLIFVDGVPYPYHLAISPQWLVHYGSAGMRGEAWKRAEEERFLADPGAVLGKRAMTAITQVARRLDLEFAGIDCALLPDGRVLLFEANATMNVHLNDPPDLFAYKHRFVPRIFAAFTAMLERRLIPANH